MYSNLKILRILKGFAGNIFIIPCPKCKGRIRYFPNSFKEWRGGKRRCSGCGAWIVLSNPAIFGGIVGLLVGGLIVSSRYWGFSNEWIRLEIVVLVAWFLTPIILKIFGNWQVVENELEVSAEIRKMNQKWCNTFAISSLILGILNFLSVPVLIFGLFVIKSWTPEAFLFLLFLNLTVFWSWSIVLGIIALKMIAKGNGKTQVRKPAVFGIVLGIISGIAEVGIFLLLFINIKMNGF